MIIQGNDSFTQPSFPLSHRARRQAWSLPMPCCSG